MCGKVSSPTYSTRSASARVRAACAGVHATRVPACSESRASAASSGSTPMILVSGNSALTATAMPEMRPPPLHRHDDGAACRRLVRGEVFGDLQADRALPGDHVAVVEGRDWCVARTLAISLGGRDPGGERGLDADQLGAGVDAIASVLTAGAFSGHDDRGLDRAAGRVRDGEPVVAA